MRRLLAACVMLLVAGPAIAADYPHVYLKNDKLKVKVYLPDAQKGFYRGTRFDWAGVCGEVEFAGHKLFGPWKETHDPTNHDDIIGPCEEFGNQSPLGYDEAKPGETFLKIGVGELEKPNEEKYSFAKQYKVVKPLEWKSERSERFLEWKTSQAANGYAYSYRKSVGLDAERAEITLSHTLKNTGKKRIVTDFYNHNFFNVDGDAVGPNYSFAFPFEPKAKDMRGKFGELVELKEKELRFKDKLPGGDFVMAELTGYDTNLPEHWSVELRHVPSGVRVAVGHGYAFAKLKVWGVKTTICPEPFLALDLEPGQEMTWYIHYSFTHSPPKK